MKQIAVLLIGVISLLPERLIACTRDDPCDPTSSSQYGEPVKLSPGQLRKRLIHCELPRLSGALDAQATVLVQLLVTPKGTVGCAKMIRGSDLIEVNNAAMIAVKKWIFRPLKVTGKAVPVRGFVSVFVSWDVDKMRKDCKKD